jgi:hypothetical protein
VDIAWIEASGINYLVAGCDGGSLGMRQVKIDQGQCQVSLRWMPTTTELDVKDAIIQDVQGLSQLDKQLLTQRGARGEPTTHRLRETSKKVATMASVVSKLKTLSPASNEPTEDHTLKMGASVEQLMQRAEQSNDPLFQELVMTFVKNIHGYK